MQGVGLTATAIKLLQTKPSAQHLYSVQLGPYPNYRVLEMVQTEFLGVI